MSDPVSRVDAAVEGGEGGAAMISASLVSEVGGGL